MTLVSAVLNPESPYYQLLRNKMLEDYEDNYWAEDAIFMERNSRDFVLRIQRINVSAEAICDTLRASPFGRPVESGWGVSDTNLMRSKRSLLSKIQPYTSIL